MAINKYKTFVKHKSMNEQQNLLNEQQQPVNIAGVIARYSIRSKTNAGELCRQDFRIVTKKEDIHNAALCVRKYVLAETDSMFEVYENYGFDLLKIFKGKRLYRQVYAIKLNTLQEVVSWLNGLNN